MIGKFEENVELPNRTGIEPGCQGSLETRECLICALVRRWSAAPRWCRCLGGAPALAGVQMPHLGLHAPGGDRVGQCRVVAFGLVGVGLSEFGHGLVEFV